MKIKLPNGITLDQDGRWAAGITRHARDKGIDNLTGFLAIRPDGTTEYLLVEYPEPGAAGVPIYAGTSFEAVCVHIDMLWADKTMPK